MSLFVGVRGRIGRLAMWLDSSISSTAGRLRQGVDDILDIEDRMDDCDVRDGNVDVIRDRSISSSGY